MVEHGDDNLLAFQTAMFQFSLFLFALRREKKRENSNYKLHVAFGYTIFIPI